MACTIPSIKSQAFAGDHPTPGQKSRVILKGDGMNEGAVHLEGFGGRSGFGRRPALIVVDMTLGFTDPESPLGSELDSPIEVIRKLLRAERRAEIPVTFTTLAYRESHNTTAAAFLDKFRPYLYLGGWGPLGGDRPKNRVPLRPDRGAG
jgi:hypothetical protein